MNELRFSYGVSVLSDEQARAIALENARSTGTLHEDDTLAQLREPRTFPPLDCCDLNDAAKRFSTAIAREIVGWATLLEAGRSAEVRACARWKIERLVEGQLAVEQLLLERDHLSEDEDAGSLNTIELAVRF